MRIASALFHSVIAVVVFVGLIDTIFRFSRIHFILQFIFVLGLIALTFLGLLAMHNRFRAGWLLLVFVYSLVLLDLLWIWYWQRSLHEMFFLTLAISALALVITVAGMPSKPVTKEPEAKAEKLETYKERKTERKKPKRRKR